MSDPLEHLRSIGEMPDERDVLGGILTEVDLAAFLDTLASGVRNIIAEGGVERAMAETTLFLRVKVASDPVVVAMLLARALVERAQREVTG